MTPLLSMLAGARAFGMGLFRGQSYAPEGSAYEIAKYVVPSGGLAEVVFAIPSGYRHLRIESLTIGTAGSQDVIMRFNGVTASSNYSWHELRGNGATTSAHNGTNTNAILYSSNSTDPTYPTATVADILDYSSSTKAKTVRIIGGRDYNGGGTVSVFSGTWYASTNPITSISLFVPGAYQFNQNSTFTLIGYK